MKTPMPYTLIRSKRKTVSLTVTPDGIVVRAPLRMSKQAIDDFVESRRGWIETHSGKMEARERELAAIVPLTDAQLRGLAERARVLIPQRLAHYAPLVRVRYNRVTIRAQRSRWGSCSSKGNLSFNCLLLLTPSEVLDSVVVHELCHLKELNHSPAFYREVYRVCPDYDACRAWLKKNGAAIMRRHPL